MDVIPLLLNKVVCEFADLSFIDTLNFGFLRCAERQTGDQVHDEQDDASDTERVTETSHAIAELVRKLDPVMVEPASRNHSDTIESGNVIGSEQTTES